MLLVLAGFGFIAWFAGFCGGGLVSGKAVALADFGLIARFAGFAGRLTERKKRGWTRVLVEKNLEIITAAI